jgi:hypothetical protein
LSVFLNPQARRATSLASRFVPSVFALVIFVFRKARTAGHQVSIVVARVVASGMSASAHQR